MNLLPFGGNCTWSRVELGDVEHWELVVLDKFACFLVHLIIFGWEAAYDIGGEGHIRNMLLQEIADLVELLDCVLSVHFVKNRV